ncbi:MAG TPA: CDP-diacylglycerol--glycerol-3-phosphate 3-phosphatidyltransferase [Thermoanaerobaculia bacterium]|nr:CDP-diacylglycerol--glycerol-3-phosphate 3-phosphatidyltransferase [Thermoanaerobaculia bacterium]HQR67392.1 CDP-diacylglycerol--glycerol-3-phosphate 3-phosphatidyltransferase [Thermoanaerobaculia bacterium]
MFSVNVPNALTLLRIFLVPLLVVILLTRMPAKEYLALLIFLLAALTDALDGYWARKYKKVTTLGTLLDPIADKLLVSAALISLVDLQEADAWAVCIIIGREFAVSGLRSIGATHGIVIPASKLGKWKMATQVVGISLMILGARLDDIGLWRRTGRAALYVMTAVTLVSGFDYFRRYLRELLLRERAAAPVPLAPAPAKDRPEHRPA